jgi:hypothetical protein
MDLFQNEVLDEGCVCFVCDSYRNTILAAGLRFLGAWEVCFQGVEIGVEFSDVMGEVGLTSDRAMLYL